MDNKLTLHTTRIEGVMIIKNLTHGDSRGTFKRWFCLDELSKVFPEQRISQINHSFSEHKGTVRGMHFQRPPNAETKFVRCLTGRVWDVVVDVRKGSPTFLQWQAFELARSDNQMVMIPPGCAHGFQTLEANSELLYLHSHPYTHNAEDGLAAQDIMLNISWPLPIKEMSVRDRSFVALNADFQGLSI